MTMDYVLLKHQINAMRQSVRFRRLMKYFQRLQLSGYYAYERYSDDGRVRIKVRQEI